MYGIGFSIIANERPHSLTNEVKLLKVMAENTQFEECRVHTLRRLKNAFVSGVLKPGSQNDIKLIRKLFVRLRSSWQVHVPCRLTFERLATFRTIIPSERD